MHKHLLAMAAAVAARAYHIGAPGSKWGPAELSKWRAERIKSRSYDDDVVKVLESLRDEYDAVVLKHVVSDSHLPALFPAWEIWLRRGNQEELYEVGQNFVDGWGHLQSKEEVVAFGVEDFGRQPGTYSVTLGESGQTSFAFAPSQPNREHKLVVYNHYISNPVQIGAATSPFSMLNPLNVVCDRERYVVAGLEAPTR